MADLTRRELVDQLIRIGASALAAAMGAGSGIQTILEGSAAPRMQGSDAAPGRKYRYGIVIDTRWKNLVAHEIQDDSG